MTIVKPKVIIIIISGPTASGKSDVAIKLAQKFRGEIISADSRQIFRGLDLGTGKVKKDNAQVVKYISEGIMHYLIDIVDPMEEFNVSHFKKHAEKAINTILKKGKVPIICGGTGFWIDSIIKNSDFPEVKPDPELRKKLDKKTTDELFKKLNEKDPDRAKNIDPKNKIRLIRALEIIESLGKVPSQKEYEQKYAFFQIGIKTEKNNLNEKIKKRLETRFNEGMILEVENLHNKGVSWEWMDKIGLEYRWISRYLQDKISLNEMKEKLYFDIIHYAKRQMTWLKKNKGILWLSDYKEIEMYVKSFLLK